MRRIILALLLSLALPVAAQSTPPKKLVPIPEPPEMPLPSPSPGTEQDASLEPQVTIITRGTLREVPRRGCWCFMCAAAGDVSMRAVLGL